MPNLTEKEAQVLSEVSQQGLMKDTEVLSQWEKVSGTPGEREAVAYIKKRLEEIGARTTLYEFESLIGWPEGASLEIVSPVSRTIHAITQSLVPSAPAEGLLAEAVYLANGEEADFQAAPAAGKIVVLEGMPSPVLILRAQNNGALGLVFLNQRLRDMCVSPVWGTPTTKTAHLLPKTPTISITKADGAELKELMEKGPVQVRLHSKNFLGWRPVPVLVGDIPGAVEPDKYLLFSGHHCSWYYGATDNVSANATMLDIARIVSQRRGELRRSIRFAFWPGHTQGRYSGSTWYIDQNWEDLYDNCVFHLNVDSSGGKGAIYYHVRCTPDVRDFGLAVVRDAIDFDAEVHRMPRAADQSFWALGIPSLMTSCKVPAEMAADQGTSLFAAAGSGGKKKSGSAWWWHTPDDTFDKIGPEEIERTTKAYMLSTWRWATSPILPLRYGPAAQGIRETLERYQAAAGDRFDLGPTIERARKVEAATSALDEALDQARRRPDGSAAIANRGLMALSRALVTVDFTASGPFDQDLAVPIPAVPLLEPALRLKEMDPGASQTRFLTTELTRNRNQVAYYLRQALEAAEETAASLRDR